MPPTFLREFNFSNGRFFLVCFAGLIFAIGETVYSSLELIFAIFRKPPSIWNYNILFFFEYKQSKAGEQHAGVQPQVAKALFMTGNQ